MAKLAAILLAAGRSSRFKGDDKKPFATLDGRAVWLRSAELFCTRKDIVQTLLVISRDDEEVFRRRYQANLAFMNIDLEFGGAERSDSVAAALARLHPDAELVAIHDTARPCVTSEAIDEVTRVAAQHGAAILATPVADTLKKTDRQQKVVETPSRTGLWLAQTPQVFRKDWLLEAYARRGSKGAAATDDAQLIEALGQPVHVVPGASTNIKITTHQDLLLAEAILKSRPKPKSQSYHPFAEEGRW
ncbi:MAG TPA: 2-C-methyl-D-erythritol 4-phosphate cytidylyltransferase [Gemmatales bacterium]|nr:2-C-methyl-D-erythritol 4-phosphate cytidylyltransferase [Gemmatales bacterium]